MITLENKKIIPLGCSCINQFQIRSYFEKSAEKHTLASSIFGWNITTPATTIRFLEMTEKGDVKSLMQDRSQYTLKKKKLVHTAFEGFYFWHEDGPAILSDDAEAFAVFAEKTGHLIDNFLSPLKGHKVHFLWSNLQPNLQKVMNAMNVPWETFILSKEKYIAMRETVKVIFGSDVRITFICRRSDIDSTIAENDDVRLIEIDRGEDYRGDKNLYAPLLNQLAAA